MEGRRRGSEAGRPAHPARPARLARRRTRDEGEVERDEVERARVREVGEAQVAQVRPLEHGHARVDAHALRDLPVADVDADDVRGAALEEAVSEAAGREARVEAAAAGRVDGEGVERGLELEAAAADEARLRRGQHDRGRVLDGRPGLEDRLVVDQDLACGRGSGGRWGRRWGGEGGRGGERRSGKARLRLAGAG